MMSRHSRTGHGAPFGPLERSAGLGTTSEPVRATITRDVAATGPRVHAAVVTYGGLETASEVLASLAAQTAHLNVAVVNNGPLHHTMDSLHSALLELWSGLPKTGAIDRLTLIDQRQNLGYAAGLNTAITELGRHGAAEFVWLLNPDVVLHTDALSKLLAAARSDPRVWCWGSTHLNSGRDSVQVAGFVRYDHWRNRRKPDRWPGTLDELTGTAVADPRDHFLPGSALFLSRTAYIGLGGLNDQYFMYFEELDLARRVSARGGLLGWARASLLEHAGQGSTDRLGDSGPFVARQSAASHLRYLRTHRPALVPWGVVLRIAYALRRSLFGDIRVGAATISGVFDGVRRGRRR